MNALLIALITVLVSLAALAVFVSGRRVVRDTGRLRLTEVMQYRGASLPDPLDEAGARYHAHAVRICIACPNKPLCDEWLRAGRPANSCAFCPNAHYIEHLRLGGLAFT
ncbi:MAG: hypothetical protein EPO20_23650 [Betaproteobacteria bacterium]|nr:MAG: hypothetical protein EPO20_23650 [Betaproteobacteria bacterium]